MWPPVNASAKDGSSMRSGQNARRETMHSGTRCDACVSAELLLPEEPIFTMASLATVTIQYPHTFPFVTMQIFSQKKSNSQEYFAQQFNLFQYWLIPVSENSNLNTSIMRNFKWKTNPLAETF